MSEGTKGPRLFDWAILPMLHQWEDDGRHWLLIRRCVDDPSQKTDSFVFAPQGTTLPEMVQAIGARWPVEEHFENGKDLGMDQDARAELHRLVPAYYARTGGSRLSCRDLRNGAFLPCSSYNL